MSEHIVTHLISKSLNVGGGSFEIGMSTHQLCVSFLQVMASAFSFLPFVMMAHVCEVGSTKMMRDQTVERRRKLDTDNGLLCSYLIE